jgi:hypothetical protein
MSYLREAEDPDEPFGLEDGQFIRPDASTFTDEQAFAFLHVLICDAAYAAILRRAGRCDDTG